MKVSSQSKWARTGRSGRGHVGKGGMQWEGYGASVHSHSQAGSHPARTLVFYLVRPERLHLVLPGLVLLMVSQGVPAGAVHIGSLSDAEVAGREAADRRSCKRTMTLRQPGLQQRDGSHPRAFWARGHPYDLVTICGWQALPSL